MVFVGTTVSKAMLAAADAEEQAELTWRAMLLGTPGGYRNAISGKRRGETLGDTEG